MPRENPLFSPFYGFMLDHGGEWEIGPRIQAYFKDRGVYCYAMQDSSQNWDTWEDERDSITKNPLIIFLATSRRPFTKLLYERDYSKTTIIFALDGPSVLPEDVKSISMIVRARNNPPDAQDMETLYAAYNTRPGSNPALPSTASRAGNG